MNVTQFLNVSKKDKIADISIIGDIGYNVFADTYEEYKQNTSEAKASELNALKELNVNVINLTLESLGGDLSHALAIYSMLKNSGAKINTYYRGANASSSTIIGSAATSVDNIYMDSTGLYLIHKPMTMADGNSNDLKQTIKDLDKWQAALEQAYIGLGVSQDNLNKLMARNGGHGEWLTFNEAKEYGFVGNNWDVNSISNYSRSTFENKNILIPNQFNNQKPVEMEEQKPEVVNEDKTLLQKIWNKLSNDSETPSNDVAVENEVTPEEQTNLVSEVMQILEPRLVALEEALEGLKPSEEEVEEPIEEEEVEEVEAKYEDDEEKEEEEDKKENIADVIKNEVKEAIKNLVEPTTIKNQSTNNADTPIWKQHLNNFHNFIK
tara:strand:- start:463 stop:1602 length:1140 start_codon:yes stop_codon:yes gene_type:complete